MLRLYQCSARRWCRQHYTNIYEHIAAHKPLATKADRSADESALAEAVGAQREHAAAPAAPLDPLREDIKTLHGEIEPYADRTDAKRRR